MHNKLDQTLLAIAAILLLAIFLTTFRVAPEATQKPAMPAAPMNLASIRWPSPPTVTDTGVRSDKEEATSFIQIQWPTASAERHKIRQVLHQCLGVSLAKVDRKGSILQREHADEQNYSQYARQFSQPMDTVDARLELRWRDLPGQLVRLYPITLDQKLFAAMGVTGEGARVTGRFRWQQNSLIMTHITVNDQIRSGLMTLYRGNPSTC